MFFKAFQREKSVPLLYLGFCTQNALSYLLPVLFLEESQDVVLWKLLPSLVIKGANDLNLQGLSWSHKHESLYFFFNHKCGCLCCKGLIEKESVDSELARGPVSKF